MKNIKKILAPFNLGLGRKQDLGTLLIHLRDNEVTTDEIIDYIEGLKKNIRAKQKEASEKQIRWYEVALKCPVCGKIMRLIPINTTPSNQVNENLHSLWFCVGCDYEQYNIKTVEEIWRK